MTPANASTSLNHDQSVAASSLFSYSDPFNDAATQYDFWDTGSGGGHFVLNGSALGTNQDNFVTAAQLAQTTYMAGSGSDTLWVRASDGAQWSPWSQSFTVAGPIDNGPVVALLMPDISTSPGQFWQVANMVAPSDPFNDPIDQYDLWNDGTAGAHFVLNGSALGVNQDNDVTAAQFAQVEYESGSGTDRLWVRAEEGGQWGAWSHSITVSDPPPGTGWFTSEGEGMTMSFAPIVPIAVVTEAIPETQNAGGTVPDVGLLSSQMAGGFAASDSMSNITAISADSLNTQPSVVAAH